MLLDDNYCGHATVSPIHDHPVFEAHFILNGQYVLQANDQKIILGSNTGCIIKPNVFHSILPMDPVTIKFCFKFFIVKPSPLLSHIMKSRKWEKGIFIYDQTTKEIEYLNEILMEFEHRDIGYKTSIENLFSQLLLTITRKIMDTQRTKEDQELTAYEVLVNEIDEFLYKNYMKDISLADMARHMDISERQVNRLMLKVYGSSFKRKVIQIRLTAAKNMLLQNSDMTVAQIAEAVGYNDPYYFSRVFKNSTGKSPEEFRRKADS